LPNRRSLGTPESGQPTKCPHLDGTWKAKAGDPPELAQDNPPPWSGGSAHNPVKLIPPGLIVVVLFVLILSAAFYAALPYRRSAYVPILVTTALGFALGQLWDYVGLPSIRIGQANLLPAAVFALLLQLAARFVPRPRREPKEPAETQSRTS